MNVRSVLKRRFKTSYYCEHLIVFILPYEANVILLYMHIYSDCIGMCIAWSPEMAFGETFQ